MGSIRMGETLRYARPYESSIAEIDELPNYFNKVGSDGRSLPLLEAGINPIGSTRGCPTPAILISSSPHKVGSSETPWQDFFRPDFGHIRYFGDNRKPGNDPALSRGNQALLEQFEKYLSTSSEVRKIAAPLIFFRRVRVGDRAKGNVQFQGIGLIERVERLVQIEPITGMPFVNYVFDFAVFSLADENESFDWRWIEARRDPSLSADESLRYAPLSWRKWVKGGRESIELCRRRVSKLMVVPPSKRKPAPNSAEDRTLSEIYRYYDGRKGRFEALAAFLAKRLMSGEGSSYLPGWITPASGDGGADFIGRLDVGTDMARLKLVVLGQAKCERPDSPTGGNHVARTVARLRRGWLGVYVTTSYFSEAVQREVIEDQYPIMLVDGHRVASEVAKIKFERNDLSASILLDEIDATYGANIAKRSPEEILLL